MINIVCNFYLYNVARYICAMLHAAFVQCCTLYLCSVACWTCSILHIALVQCYRPHLFNVSHCTYCKIEIRKKLQKWNYRTFNSKYMCYFTMRSFIK